MERRICLGSIPRPASQEQPAVRGETDSFGIQFESRHHGLNRLKQWVALNGALTLTRSQAATIACLEPHHFSKVFRQHVGESFQQWRRRYRVAWAVSALKQGTYSLDHIIQYSGYRDRRAFERSMKQMTGHTPGSIRRNSETIECSELGKSIPEAATATPPAAPSTFAR